MDVGEVGFVKLCEGERRVFGHLRGRRWCCRVFVGGGLWWSDAKGDCHAETEGRTLAGTAEAELRGFRRNTIIADLLS